MNVGSDDTPTLLQRARDGDAVALGQLLEAQREVLRRAAQQELYGKLAVRVDPSDLIQVTFLEAQRSFPQFQGQDEAEWLAWLRGIFRNGLAKTIRDHTSLQKRDVRREQTLDAPSPEASSSQTEPAAGVTSPSQRAIRREETDRMEAALQHLPPDQREAVRLRHLEGRPLQEIADRMGRTPAATAGLIKRGLQALRKHLGADGL